MADLFTSIATSARQSDSHSLISRPEQVLTHTSLVVQTSTQSAISSHVIHWGAHPLTHAKHPTHGPRRVVCLRGFLRALRARHTSKCARWRGWLILNARGQCPCAHACAHADISSVLAVSCRCWRYWALWCFDAVSHCMFVLSTDRLLSFLGRVSQVRVGVGEMRRLESAAETVRGNI